MVVMKKGLKKETFLKKKKKKEKKGLKKGD